MTWDGKERRGETITIAEVENAVYKANEKFFDKVKKCVMITWKSLS